MDAIGLAIDLDALSDALDVLQWEWDVWVAAISLTLAFGIFVFVRYELAHRFPVDRLIGRRWFGV